MTRSDGKRDEDYQQYLWGEMCAGSFARRALVRRRLVIELADVPLGIPA